jgi:hypothetical protein
MFLQATMQFFGLAELFAQLSDGISRPWNTIFRIRWELKVVFSFLDVLWLTIFWHMPAYDKNTCSS